MEAVILLVILENAALVLGIFYIRRRATKINKILVVDNRREATIFDLDNKAKKETNFSDPNQLRNSHQDGHQNWIGVEGKAEVRSDNSRSVQLQDWRRN